MSSEPTINSPDAMATVPAAAEASNRGQDANKPIKEPSDKSEADRRREEAIAIMHENERAMITLDHKAEVVWQKMFLASLREQYGNVPDFAFVEVDYQTAAEQFFQAVMDVEIDNAYLRVRDEANREVDVKNAINDPARRADMLNQVKEHLQKIKQHRKNFLETFAK